MIRRPKTREEALRLTHSLIERRAKQERFRGAPIRGYEPPDYEVDPDHPRFLIRALYGPMKGLVASMVLGYRYDNRLLSQTVPLTAKERECGGVDPIKKWDDWSGRCGPREFLQNLFEMVAFFHGDCTIYMIHSGQEMQVDSELFRQWVERMNAEPVAVLFELKRGLLEG